MEEPPTDSSLVNDLHVQATYRLTEALVESENRMRRRIELLTEIVFETDAAGLLVFLNEAWTKVLERKIEESLGQPLEHVVLAEDRPALAAALTHQPGGGAAAKREIRMLRGDGGVAWVEVSATPLPGGGVVGALHDITREKRARDEIHLLSLVARDTDNLVVITDREGRTEWVNRAFTRRTGYELEEMVGRKPGEALQGPGTDQREVQRIHDCVVAGNSFKAELLNYTRTGEPYWVAIQVSPIHDESGRVVRFISIQTDTTEVRRAQKQLEEARKNAELLAEQAQAASRAKSVFLATMSHEIRTPMNGILGMTELLRQSELDDVQREMAGAVEESGRHLLALINDILDLARVEAGRVSLSIGEFVPAQLVDAVVMMGAHSARGRPLEVRSEIDPTTPPLLLGDSARLRQILFNLVGNGVKFTPAGSVVARLRCLGRDPERARLRFEVTDTGIGIPADKIGMLFQSFQQIDSSNSRRHGGAGLGLVISKRYVELMGGEMGVDSEEGKGSTFWFEVTLPLAPVV